MLFFFNVQYTWKEGEGEADLRGGEGGREERGEEEGVEGEREKRRGEGEERGEGEKKGERSRGKWGGGFILSPYPVRWGWEVQ